MNWFRNHWRIPFQKLEPKTRHCLLFIKFFQKKSSKEEVFILYFIYHNYFYIHEFRKDCIICLISNKLTGRFILNEVIDNNLN